MALTKITRGLLNTGVSDSSDATAITIDSSENVGIGTASPSGGSVGGKVLHLVNSGGTASVRVDRSDSSTTGTISLLDANSTYGLFGTGSKPMAFSTNSTERMRIDSAGRLGIGTSAPTRQLVVSNGDANGIEIDSNITGESEIISFNRSTSSFTDLNFRANSYFFRDGNVGILTDSPANNLHVGIDSGGEGILVKSTGDHSGVLQFNTNRSNSNRVLGQLLGTWNGTDVCDIQLKTADDTANKDNGQITFSTSTADNMTERMRLNDAGSLAIGNTSPQAKLHVTIEGTVPTIASETVAVFNRNGGLSHEANVSIIGGATGASVIHFGDNDEDIGRIRYKHESGNVDHMEFYVAGSERVRIDSNGLLMVGTTATNTHESSGAGNEGIVIRPAAFSTWSVSNELCQILNRKTSNGVIMQFNFNGSSVGTISTNANSLPSDRNFKRNIEDLNIGLDLVTKLNPVSYNYKIDNDGTPKMFGLIAQDLEQSLEEVGVDKNSVQLLQHKPNDDEKESDYSLDYLKLTPILIKAIQEQQKEIEKLKQNSHPPKTIEEMEGYKDLINRIKELENK